MSWKHRQAKRKKRAAVLRDQRQARASGSSSPKWWLTLVSQNTCCANVSCRRPLRIGNEMVYRAKPRTALCVACAQESRLFYRPSRVWENSRIAGRKARNQTRQPGKGIERDRSPESSARLQSRRDEGAGTETQPR